MRETIIIGCSQRKKGKSGKVYELYDGPIWQTFRKYNTGKYRVFAISAKYGLIPIDKIISDYNTLLGRDITVNQLSEKIKKQKKKYRFGKITLFAGKKYAEAMKKAGFNFKFVEGGIGDKRSKLGKKLRSRSKT